MKILIVDRDDLTRQMIRNKIELLGHEIDEEPDKNEAIKKIEETEYGLVLIDPAPLNNPRPVVMNIRRSVDYYCYVTLISDTFSREEAFKAGANDLLKKPMDASDVKQKAANAEYLMGLVKRIGDTSEDFMSAGGVIAKSAFNQLFLSGVDRADRYGEKSFVLFIALSNYQKIYEEYGHYAADYAVAKLCKKLTHIRRQSDIIGQTRKNEYALLLQRPVYETEPVEAANRFALTLSQSKDLTQDVDAPLEITVTLVDLPVGSKVKEHVITHEAGEATKEQA